MDQATISTICRSVSTALLVAGFGGVIYVVKNFKKIDQSATKHYIKQSINQLKNVYQNHSNLFDDQDFKELEKTYIEISKKKWENNTSGNLNIKAGEALTARKVINSHIKSSIKYLKNCSFDFFEKQDFQELKKFYKTIEDKL